MLKILRIAFCILSCLCLAALVPVAVFFEWWCLFCLLGALLFGGAMFFVIRLSEPKPAPRPDFMKSDEENAEINRGNGDDREN